VQPVLQMWSGDAEFNKQSGGASITFSNFAVNAGQLSCPDAGAGGAGGNTGDAGPAHVGGGSSGSCGCSLFGQSRSGANLLSLGLLGLLIVALRRRA